VLVGVLAFPVASLATSLAMGSPAGGRIIAAAALLIVALYRL